MEEVKRSLREESFIFVQSFGDGEREVLSVSRSGRGAVGTWHMGVSFKRGQPPSTVAKRRLRREGCGNCWGRGCGRQVGGSRNSGRLK